jgi:hypothetical protein
MIAATILNPPGWRSVSHEEWETYRKATMPPAPDEEWAWVFDMLDWSEYKLLAGVTLAGVGELVRPPCAFVWSYRNDFNFDIEETVWAQLEAVQDLGPDCVVPRDPEVITLGGYPAVSAVYDHRGVEGPGVGSRLFNEFIALEVGARMIVAILEWNDTDECGDDLREVRASIRIAPVTQATGTRDLGGV